MPSRKQRRRREKLQRHEYEYVVETDEGEEVVERPTEREKKPEDSKRGGKRGRPARAGRTREVPKPSLQRVIKRTGLVLPFALLVVFLFGRSLTMQQKIFQALLLLAFFIPMSYVVDVFMYRAYQRRQAKRGGGPTKSP